MPRQAGADKIRLLELTHQMIEAGVEELARQGLAISAREAPDMIANLWSAVEDARRRELSCNRRQRG